MRHGRTSATQTCGADGGHWGAATVKLAMCILPQDGGGRVAGGMGCASSALEGRAGMEKQSVGILAKPSGVQGGVSVPAWET